MQAIVPNRIPQAVRNRNSDDDGLAAAHSKLIIALDVSSAAAAQKIVAAVCG